MRHLNDEEIFRLAEISEEDLTYSRQELDMMEHLKTCTDCYDRFCSVLALLGVTSESGYVALADAYGMKSRERQTLPMGDKVLAAVRIMKKQLEQGISIVLEQIEQSKAAFQFAPLVPMGARGITAENADSYRLEDYNDDKTFIVLNQLRNELLIQVNIKNRDISAVEIFLETESGKRIDIPLTRKGSLIKGVLENIPEEKFKIMIEKADQ